MHIDEEFFTNIPLAMFFIDSINKVGIMAPTLPGKYGIVMKSSMKEGELSNVHFNFYQIQGYSDMNSTCSTINTFKIFVPSYLESGRTQYHVK